MRSLLLAATLCSTLFSSAQYYYKDIIGSFQTSDLIKNYKTNKVSRVLLASYNADDSKNDDFYVEQQFNSDALKTITRSNVTSESVLISYVDGACHVLKTIDSSEAVTSTTSYTYNNAGQLISVTNFTADTANI